jgi:hypothetical protein
MVSAEMAARLVGSEVTGMTVTGAQAWTQAVTGWTETDTTSFRPNWVGSFVQSQQVATSQEWISLVSNSNMKWPQDVLLVNRVFHASTSGDWLVNATGTKGIFQQQYVQVEPGDLARVLSGYSASLSVASNNTGSSVYYAAVGAIFASATSDSYGPQWQVWPHHQGAADSCFALIEYAPAPTPVGAADSSKSNVYMSKYPDVFMSGVLRYAWLYLGQVENYMRAKKEWEDGLAKIAGVSRSFAHQPVVGGRADHDHLNYLRG